VHGYIILITFIFFVLGCFFSFIGGWLFGKKQAAAENLLKLEIKAETEKDFKQLKRSLFIGGDRK